MLLPIEIENVKFSRGVGGYLPREVDDFLEYIKGKYVEDADKMMATLASQKERIERLEGESAASAELESQLREALAECEAQKERSQALEEKMRALETENAELKDALAEAISQAAAKAAEALPVNNVAAAPVWDPDAADEIPEPFGDTEPVDEMPEPVEAADETEQIDETETADEIDEAEAVDEIDEAETVDEIDEADVIAAAEDAEPIETDAEIDDGYGDDERQTDAAEADESDESDDGDIGDVLEAALAKLDLGADKQRDQRDHIELEDLIGELRAAADNDDGDGGDGGDKNGMLSDKIDVSLGFDDLLDFDEEEPEAEDAFADENEDGENENGEAAADNVAETAPEAQYGRRVYHIRLKRSAKKAREDQSILDALRAAYDVDDTDDGGDAEPVDADDAESDGDIDDIDIDMTPREYDEYNYFFDSGKK